MGRLGLGPLVIGRIWSGLRISASFHIDPIYFALLFLGQVSHYDAQCFIQTP